VAPLRATVCSANPHKLAEFRELFGDWDLELLDRAEFRRCQGIPNSLERDWQFKRALGFPDETAVRTGKLLRL